MAAARMEPAFITYLLRPDLDHDCYFLVGDSQHEEPEKIGAVKKMLLAHSVVMRAELQDSKMSEKGVVCVEDLYPDTFRNLLKYVYGYDNISDLTFDEADNLLYAAEKFIMGPLKAKLSVLLLSMLDANNICSLMNNPACFKVLELESAITKILQDETENVLSNPAFLDFCPHLFFKILEQDMLNVTEIELWKAVLKWGKHQVGSEGKEALRNTLTDPMKHIRILTLDLSTFCKEVVPTRILTYDEVDSLYNFYSNGVQPVCLDSFSSNLEPRVKPKMLEMKFSNHPNPISYRLSTITLQTYASGIVLMPMQFLANTGPSISTYLCECTIKITDITDNTTTPPVKIEFRDEVKCGTTFDVPITYNGTNVRFLPNKKYQLEVNFDQPHQIFYNTVNYQPYANNHISISVLSNLNYYMVPVKSLWYRASSG